MSTRLTWIHLPALVCIATLTLLCLAQVAPAGAATYGELGKTGSFGEALGQFDYPSALAVDQTDNSVYVLDEPGASERGAGPTSFRIQKFGANLAQETSVDIATPLVSGHAQVIEQIAVDPELNRLYVLEGVETGRSGADEYAAERIYAYSTQTKAGEPIQPVPGVKYGSSKEGEGIFYEFPAVPSTGTVPAGTVGAPDGLAVDPKTHDLLVLGGDENGDPVIQEISISDPPDYSSGASGGAFDDTAHEVTRVGSAATGIAVGPEGVVYVTSTKIAQGDLGRGVVRLSIEAPNSLSKPAISGLASSEPGEQDALTGGVEANGKADAGAQVSVASEGGLVYAMEEGAEKQGGLAGDYIIRGIDSESGSQQVAFGGGTSPKCHISASANAIGAGSGGVVYALDEGEPVYNNVSEEWEHSSYGFSLVKFGPEGSGCPTPSASFEIDGKPAGATVTIRKGETADFDAKESELHGEEPAEVEWDLDGSGKYATVIDGNSGLETSMEYLTPGRYTIGLKILLQNGGSFGDPPPTTGTLVVEASPPTASFEAFPSGNLGEPLRLGETIKPGEAVTFNGKESSDPTGQCSPGHGCGPTHTLKSYTWSFGDGETETTTTPEYTRTFTNTGTEARTETVSLTVTNEEGIESTTPATLTPPLTIEGVEPTKEPVKESPAPVKEAVKETPPAKIVPPVTPPAKKPLTTTQKLAAALKVCKKDKSKKLRASCEKAAHKRYAPKPKKKPKKK